MAHEPLRIGPPASQILETEIGEEISLYDPRSENVVVLNQTASDIWRLCDGESDLDAIVTLLAGAYGVEPDEIKDEISETVDSFISQGLLHSESQ